MILNNNYSYRPDEERLSKIEKTWGVRLPEEIRILLIEDNGGVPEKRNFPCGKRTRMIVRFLCIKEKGTDEDYAWYDINVVLTQLEERMIRALSTDSKKSNYRLDIDYWLYGDNVYRGNVFIPLTNNLNAANNSWGD